MIGAFRLTSRVDREVGLRRQRWRGSETLEVLAKYPQLSIRIAESVMLA